MENGPSAALDQQAPVLELNCDILGEIFERCDSLSIICRSSQVCRRWREFLLESPSLWARNIDLYALGHQSDCWRKLVLKRTGRALLSVTGGELTPYNRFGLLDFLVDLLDDQWARIRDLEITIARSALDDQRIWQAFGRPAPNLRTFSCLLSPFAGVFDVIPPVENLPPNFRLFSNHAPSLAGLYLGPTFPPISLNITPPTLFTSSLRNLKFTRTLRLTDIDLLTACMHMPFIETLSLSLERFFRSPPSEICALRPLVPRLKSIKLTDTDPSVYSAFLDHIIPSADCALSIDNHLDAWSRLAADKASLEAGDIAHMGRVVGRYVNSYFEHEGAPFARIVLVISQRQFSFAVRGWHESFEITATYMHHELDVSLPNFLLQLFESHFSTKLPESITTLNLAFRDQNNFLSHSPSLQAFASMSSITVLDTESPCLFYLVQLKMPSLPFPHLNTIILRDYSLDSSVNSLQKRIQPFLLRRFHMAPIKVLEFVEPFNRPSDVRFLDTFSGMKVVWRVEWKPGPLEYVCGSGNSSELYFESC